MPFGTVLISSVSISTDPTGPQGSVTLTTPPTPHSDIPSRPSLTHILVCILLNSPCCSIFPGSAASVGGVPVDKPRRVGLHRALFSTYALLPMEDFTAFIEGVLTRLWDPDTVAAQLPEYPVLLQMLAEHASARKLASKKSFHQTIRSSDHLEAIFFVLRINADNAEEGQDWHEKLRCIRQLPDDAFVVAAIHLSLTDLVNFDLGTIKTLCEGYRRVARWSDWHNDLELRGIIEMRTHREAIVPTLLGSNIPDNTHTAQQTLAFPWILKCRSCRQELVLQCACSYQTGKPP